MFFNRLPGIGLDIGEKTAKLVRMKKRNDNLQIKTFGSIPIPAGAVESGIVFDPEMLGKELKVLVRDLKLNGKRVVSAVGGGQVYIRNLVMPRMKLNEMREAVQYQAMKFLPISVEEAAMDIFPVRDFEDEEGLKTEIFFVAVRKQQVENLESACSIAGLKLVAVEIEPMAIYRVLGNGEEDVFAFLEMGMSRSYFAVFKKGILVFYRSLPFGTSGFMQNMGFGGGQGYNEQDEIDVRVDDQYDYLLGEIVSDVKRSLEYYNTQIEMGEKGIDKFFLCGEGFAIKGLDSRLAEGLEIEVEVADILPRLILPSNISDLNKIEIQHNYMVALGLAAREVI